MTETTPFTWDDIDNEIKFVSPMAFCESCRREVPFLVHKTRKSGLWEGVKYKYRGKKANCRVCGATIYLPEIIKYNFQKLIAESKKEKYKEKTDGTDTRT